MKKESKDEMRNKKANANSPEHSIHCDKDPCVFMQIELRLTDIDATIYYDEEEYENNSVAYNSG